MKNISKVKDLTGQKFGRLTVIGIDDRQTRKTFWVCRCDCGKYKTVRSDILQSGKTKSCGCLKKEQDKENLSKHPCYGIPATGTRLYYIWRNMKSRCYNLNDARYSMYGEKGVSVCDEWKNDFSAFYNWSIENGYKDDLTIDRIDCDGIYSPENCRWATDEQQARNRHTNINITIGNSTRTLAEWCDIFNLNYSMVLARFHSDNAITLDKLFSPGQYRGKR